MNTLWTTAERAVAARQSPLVPVPPARPPQLVGRVFRRSTVVTRGLLTRKQLRSTAWRRLRQDVDADASLPVTHRLMVSAVGLVMPEGPGFTGRSAGRLWGVRDVATPTDLVDVVIPTGSRWNAGPSVRVRTLPSGQVLVRRGRWLCASRVDTAVDLIRWGATLDAVVLPDRLCLEGMVRLYDVREAVQKIPKCQGSARARLVAELADGTAESPQETRLRLLLGSAGLPEPVAQFRVFFDEEGFVARVDFAHPDLRIAIEYDGLWHGGTTAFLDDRRRMNRLAAAGWTVLHVTAADMRHPERLAAQVRALRAQRLAGTTRVSRGAGRRPARPP